MKQYYDEIMVQKYNEVMRGIRNLASYADTTKQPLAVWVELMQMSNRIAELAIENYKSEVVSICDRPDEDYMIKIDVEVIEIDN